MQFLILFIMYVGPLRYNACRAYYFMMRVGPTIL